MTMGFFEQFLRDALLVLVPDGVRDLQHMAGVGLAVLEEEDLVGPSAVAEAAEIAHVVDARHHEGFAWQLQALHVGVVDLEGQMGEA
jgi:hypothetical protein